MFAYRQGLGIFCGVEPIREENADKLQSPNCLERLFGKRIRRVVSFIDSSSRCVYFTTEISTEFGTFLGSILRNDFASRSATKSFQKALSGVFRKEPGAAIDQHKLSSARMPAGKTGSPS